MSTVGHPQTDGHTERVNCHHNSWNLQVEAKIYCMFDFNTLNLPSLMKSNLTFHVDLLKPYHDSTAGRASLPDTAGSRMEPAVVPSTEDFAE